MGQGRARSARAWPSSWPWRPPTAALAEEGSGSSGSASFKAYTSPRLLIRLASAPGKTFDVIVDGTQGKSTADVAREVKRVMADVPGKGLGVRLRYSLINATAAQLTGRQILALARRAASSRSRPTHRSFSPGSRQAALALRVGRPEVLVGRVFAATPTIAIVDSGIQASRADFGGRVLAEVNLTSLAPNSPGDGRGHGTFVAGIAAGSADGYAGAAPVRRSSRSTSWTTRAWR